MVSRSSWHIGQTSPSVISLCSTMLCPSEESITLEVFFCIFTWFCSDVTWPWRTSFISLSTSPSCHDTIKGNEYNVTGSKDNISEITKVNYESSFGTYFKMINLIIYTSSNLISILIKLNVTVILEKRNGMEGIASERIGRDRQIQLWMIYKRLMHENTQEAGEQVKDWECFWKVVMRAMFCYMMMMTERVKTTCMHIYVSYFSLFSNSVISRSVINCLQWCTSVKDNPTFLCLPVLSVLLVNSLLFARLWHVSCFFQQQK